MHKGTEAHNTVAIRSPYYTYIGVSKYTYICMCTYVRVYVCVLPSGLALDNSLIKARIIGQ